MASRSTRLLLWPLNCSTETPHLTLLAGYESHTHGSTNHCGHGCHDFIQQTHVKISPRTGGCEPQLNDVRIRESWVFSENQGDFCLKKRVGMIARPKQVSTEAYSSGTIPYLPLLNRRISLYFILHDAPKWINFPKYKLTITASIS